MAATVGAAIAKVTRGVVDGGITTVSEITIAGRLVVIGRRLIAVGRALVGIGGRLVAVGQGLSSLQV